LAPSSNAHTYRLLIFKELYLVLPCRMVRIVLFAATEKRDYAAILQSRQPLIFASFRFL
jgi:hypothetical protein